ncbi:MAG TPA: hypothetical protein VJR89_02035 [Polyangiales bacterium]|nr:hypothetical protein [Polyangiales bacterium]
MAWRRLPALLVCALAACGSEGSRTQAAASCAELHTRFAGDEYCLPPPPEDKGFQLHIGPSDYEDPEPEYVLQPNQEVTTLFPAVSGNDRRVYFYYRQFRMRPGTHHNIVGTEPAGAFGLSRRLAITNHLVEDNPKDGVIAPENAGVGIALEPHTPLIVDVHSINTSDRPALREIWVNFWYRDPEDVTEPVEELAQPGDTNLAIPPRADTMLGPYRCAVWGEGRMLWMYGHRHANNQRFSAWRIRGEERLLIYEAYDWEDPLLLEFSSNVTNPTVDRERGIEGGHSGVLDLRPGDFLEWECHVINKTDGVLRFTNENFTGEMCILDAELVGANCL